MLSFGRLALLSLLLGTPAGLRAQTLDAPPVEAPPSDAAPTGDTFNADDTAPLPLLAPPSSRPAAPPTVLDANTQSALTKVQTLLDANNPAALPLARQTAQGALKTLNAAVGGDALKAQTLPNDALTLRFALGALQAHALWGRAADTFGARDEAITALVRAQILIAALPVSPQGNVARDVNLELNALLRDGLPLVAPDDVLAGIAARTHAGLWKPVRSEFVPYAGLRTGLLVTQGQLFPPSPRGASLVQIPPLYRGLDTDRLPASLQLNRMVAGYTRVPTGPNAGQWRQSVRVFYASPFLTKNKRDDSLRAQQLASTFLRVHALFESQLGATNLYTRGPLDEGVTTLYLLEISAIWPQDDDDPVVLATLGPKMPPINTGQSPADLTPRTTPLVRPWMPIAGQNEAAPGEIMFWKAGLARSEGEWTRELFHEYGHVALPPLGGFRAPLEPYGNGLLGETLGMLWAANTSDAFAGSGTRADFLLHVSRQAVPARQAFVRDDPSAPHTSGTFADLRFLQGLVVATERVYGAPLLGRAFAPLARSGVSAGSALARRTLLNRNDLQTSLDATMRQTFAARRVLPIYLPAALDVPLDASALATRAPVTLRAGARASGWILVPEGATSLRIDAPALTSIGAPWKREVGATRVYFGRSGWQRLTLRAQSDTVLLNARFE